MSNAQKIGVFAGSFDPVHEGHLAAAQTARANLQLEMVYFVVEPRPRYKQGVKAFEHRSEMVRIAIKNEPKLKQIIIDEPHCTTEDTIPMLENRFPETELYLLMGDDVARRIADWTYTDTLFSAVTLGVLQRTMSPGDLKSIFNKLEAIRGKQPKYEFVENELSECSSSKVKKQLKTTGKSNCVSDAVLAYIKQHNLYGSSGRGS